MTATSPASTTIDTVRRSGVRLRIVLAAIAVAVLATVASVLASRALSGPAAVAPAAPAVSAPGVDHQQSVTRRMVLINDDGGAPQAPATRPHVNPQ